MERRRRRKIIIEDIPAKANRVLNLVLIGITLITLRVWHLGVIQHEDRLEESRRPQKRVVVEPAKRGTIRDRFNIPLAINKVKYQAAVMYSHIRQIPSIKWEKVDGKKVKKFKRKEYIAELARLLGTELNLDAERIEDLIHSKASLYNNLPYVIKEDITEQQYYRLKMLEKDWVGIYTQTLPKRHYPLGKVGGDIIGYTGAISREEYESVVQEIKTLENCLAAGDNCSEPLPLGIYNLEQAEARLKDLIEHAYMATDYVGKTGIEGKFEEELRGYHGKKSFYSDARGNFLREFPNSKQPLSGQRFLLTISAELQQYAEELLVQNEKIRVPRVTEMTDTDTKQMANKEPWIKGGAIVAMDPATGDVLALASYPRFDPNDFIASGNPEISQVKNANIRRWFETQDYIGEVWDQKRPFEREIYDLKDRNVAEEKIWLTWDRYLEFVLPNESEVKEALKKVKTVGTAIAIQNNAKRLQSLTDQRLLYPLFNLIYKGASDIPHGPRLPAVQQEGLEEAVLNNGEQLKKVKKELDPHLAKIPGNYDKVLLIDLCSIVVDAEKVPDHLLSLLNKMSLSSYRQNNAAWSVIDGVSKQLTKELYREAHFKKWKELHQKAFLKEKREEEKISGIKYPKPYLDLLDKKEEELFAIFWENCRWDLLHAFLTGKISANEEELEPYYNFFITWQKELLQGAHKAVEWHQSYTILQNTVSTLSNEQSIALMRSFRNFKDLNRPLFGKYRYLRKEQNQQLEKHLAAAFYPTYGFGYGRSHAYRQATTQGSIFKIVTAYEALVQRYNSIQKGPKNYATLNPFIMVDDTHKRGKAIFVGFDANGREIPQLYKGGRIPRSHRAGIGKIDLVKAFEVSSNPYFSLLAVDFLDNPNDLSIAAQKFCLGSRTGIDLPGEIAGRVPDDLDCNRHGLYAMAIGQHSLIVTPLQTAIMISAIANGGKTLKPKIVNMMIGKDGVNLVPTEITGDVFMPDEVKGILLDGMHRVFKKTQLSAWGSLAKMYEDYPEAISDFIEMKDQLIGKSSTAESVENIDLDLKLGTHIYNHTWFGGISYESNNLSSKKYVFKDPYGNPELVVVVYLRYGAWGKDTVPLAAQIAQKWREIKKKHKEDLL